MKPITRLPEAPHETPAHQPQASPSKPPPGPHTAQAPQRRNLRAPRWTPAEDALLKRLYGRHPHHVIATSLHKHHGVQRAPTAIPQRAGRLGLKPDIPRGYTRLVDAHDKRNGAHVGASQSIVRAARRAGVAKKANHVQAHPWIAPTTWVNDWLAHHYAVTLPGQAADDATAADWLPTSEVARRLGLSPTHAAYKLLRQRGRLRKLAQNVRHMRLPHRVGRPYVWHPGDVEELVRAYREPFRLGRAA